MSTLITSVRKVLLGVNGGVTTGTGDWFKMTDYVAPVIYIIGEGTISAGTLILEEADWNPDTAQGYSGTWSTIYTVVPPATSGAASIDLTALSGGKQQAIHFTGPNGYAYVRPRIGTNVSGSGGKITVVLRSTV